MNPKDLGYFLRQTRKDQGMSQAEVAARVGTTQSWVSLLESGKPRTEIGLIFKALRVLDVVFDVNVSPPNKIVGKDYVDLDAHVEAHTAPCAVRDPYSSNGH